MVYSAYFVLMTCCVLSHGFVVPMSFHQQILPSELIDPPLDILTQTLEDTTTTEASNYLIGIDPKISGFLKPPMPTPAGLTRLPGQFQNVFDVLQEFVKDPSDQNSTVLIESRDLNDQNPTVTIDSRDQNGQNATVIIDSRNQNDPNSTVITESKDLNGQNSTAISDSIDEIGQHSTVVFDSKALNGQNSTVLNDSKDLNGQNSTVLNDSKDLNGQNSTVLNHSKDLNGQNSTVLNDSKDLNGQNSTVLNDSKDLNGQNSTVLNDSKNQSEPNSTVTIDSIDRSRFNSTTGTTDETVHSLEARNLFVVGDVTNGGADKESFANITQNVMHNVTTEDEENVFPPMTLEQWLNMAGELEQVINKTSPSTGVTDLVKANDTVPVNETTPEETNTLTAGIYSTKYLAELPLTLSLRTTRDDSTNSDLNHSSAVSIVGTDGNVSSLPAAQNINENFTAFGQITVTTVSPELTDDSLRKLILTEGMMNQTINDNNLTLITAIREESIVSPIVFISENNYTHGGEYFAAPYPVRTRDVSGEYGIEPVTNIPMVARYNFSATSGVPETNSIGGVPANGTGVIDFSPVVPENLTAFITFQNNGSMETLPALRSGILLPVETFPGDPRVQPSNSTFVTVSPRDTLPIDGMSMITVSLPATNDTIEPHLSSINSTMPPFHLSGLAADVSETIDLDHLSTHTVVPITHFDSPNNPSISNATNHIPGEIYPNLDVMKAQFIVDAEQIPAASQTDISQDVLSKLPQNVTADDTSIPVITGTSVMDQLKLSSLTQPDDLTTIATVSEIIVTSQYINIPTRYPMTNAVDASGLIHVFTTSRPDTLNSEIGSSILGSIQLAKVSPNNADGMEGTAPNPEKIYYTLRSDPIEHPTDSEITNEESVAHPLENFLIPIVLTSNETKTTVVTMPISQLTVIPLQKFDATSLYETTTSTPVPESGNITPPFNNSPLPNAGASSINKNNLSNDTVSASEQGIPSVSLSEIMKENSTLVHSDSISIKNIEPDIISNIDIEANTESVMTRNDNLPVNLHPNFQEHILNVNHSQSTTNNVEMAPGIESSNHQSVNNLTKEIPTFNSTGLETINFSNVSNVTSPNFIVSQNSTVFDPPVSNPQNISDVNDLSNVYLERDNTLDTSLFLINRKPFDPRDSVDSIPSISETEKATFSSNHSIPTNEDDGPLRIPLMIPNAEYIPPSNIYSELEFTPLPVIENNASFILGLNDNPININSMNNTTVSSEIITSRIGNANDSIAPFINHSLTSLSNPESIPHSFDSNNRSLPSVFSDHETNLPPQILTNSSFEISPNLLKITDDDTLETDVNLSSVIGRNILMNSANIQVDDTNVFSVHNPSTIGVISVNGPILIPEATTVIDYNTAFINSERQHDATPNSGVISDHSYENLELPNISSHQVANQNAVSANTATIAKETNSFIVTTTKTPHTLSDSSNRLPNSALPEIIIDSTQLDASFPTPMQITPDSSNINNNLLKVPFNPEATIRFTRIENFIHDFNPDAPANVVLNNNETQLDSLQETNVSSGIESPRPPGNPLNTTEFTSASNKPETLSNSNTSIIINTLVPQTIITSANGTVVTFVPEHETNTGLTSNLTTLADEPTNTQNTTDFATQNVIFEPETTNDPPAAKSYLKTFGDAVVNGFHSFTKVFRSSESSSAHPSDESQNTVDLTLNNTDSVLIQPGSLPDTPVIDDSSSTPNVTSTLSTNPDNNNSHTKQNNSISEPPTVLNLASYPDNHDDTQNHTLSNETVQFPSNLTSLTTNETLLLPTIIENNSYANNFGYQRSATSNPAIIQEDSQKQTLPTSPTVEIPHQAILFQNLEAATIIPTFENKMDNLTNTSDKVSLTKIPAATNPEDALIAAIPNNEQANILENQKATLNPTPVENYETTPFPVVIIPNNPNQTFDQRVAEFLLNHNIITTTTKPNVPQTDDTIPYSQNVYPTLQSVETPIYVYNDVDILPKTFLLNASNVETHVHPNIPNNSEGLQPTQNSSPGFEKPLNQMVAQANVTDAIPPIILKTSYVEPYATAPTTGVLNSLKVEHHTPYSSENLAVIQPPITLNSNFVEPSLIASEAVVTNLPSAENFTSYSPANLVVVEPPISLNPYYLEPFSNVSNTFYTNPPPVDNFTPFSPANLAVEPSNILTPSYIELSENVPATTVSNLPVVETFNPIPTTNFAVGEQQIILNPNYVGLSENVPITGVPNSPIVQNFNPLPPTSFSVEPANIFNPSLVEPSPKSPTTVVPNSSEVENINSFSPANLADEPQTILKPSYVELSPNASAPGTPNYSVFENLSHNSQTSQTVLHPSYVERLPNSSSSLTVNEFGNQTLPTNLSDPAPPITSTSNIILPAPNIPNFNGLNPLVSENYPSNVTADSATHNYSNNLAQNSSAPENHTPMGQILSNEAVSPNSAHMPNSELSESSILSYTEAPMPVNNFEILSNVENVTDSSLIPSGSFVTTPIVNNTESPADLFNVISG